MSLVTQEKYLIDNSGNCAANSVSHGNFPSRRALFKPQQRTLVGKEACRTAAPNAEQSILSWGTGV